MSTGESQPGPPNVGPVPQSSTPAQSSEDAANPSNQLVERTRGYIGTSHTRVVSGQLKVGYVTTRTGKRFEIFSDEPADLQGNEEHPPPLGYLGAAVGFWLLTQVMRYASMLKKTIERAECDVQIDWYIQGSVLAGTVRSGAKACHTRLILDSPESEEDLVHVIRLAKSGCFAEQLIEHPVPLKSTYVINGEEKTLT